MKELRIPFKSWDLIAFINEKDGDEMIAVRPIAEAIGVDWKSQFRKIKSDPRFTCGHMTTHDSIGRAQNLVCLPVDELNGWLYSINSNRVKKEIKPKLMEFQKECHTAIYNHMNGSSNTEIVLLLKKMVEALVEENKTLKQRLDVHDRMLGLEASVAGKRLAAARHLKIVH